MKKRSIISDDKSYHCIVLTTVWLIFNFHAVCAQQKNTGIINTLPEKVYLQLDNKVYTNDQTIWFKSIVTNAGNHVPTRLSRVLYVELISPSEAVMDRKLIKLENGIGSGAFTLNEKSSEGFYLVRAYTKWNMNFDPAFIFKTYIRVFSSSVNKDSGPVSSVTLIKKEDNKRLLKVSLDSLLLDSLRAKKLKIIVIHNNEHDSLTLKKKKYILNYEVPDKCSFVTLQIQAEDLFNYSKTIVTDDNLDLQFFPESGELVDGLMSRVGFKALGSDGNGRIVEGEIVNSQDEVIATFKSNKMGMGSFVLTKPDSTQSYVARLKSRSEHDRILEYPLPSVVSRGNILAVVKRGEAIKVTSASNYLKNDSILIRVSCRGVAYFDIKGLLHEGRLSFTLPVKSLPEGIIAFTMLDRSNIPVAERLFFNERPESRVNIELSTDKQSYAQREQTTLKIKTTSSDGKGLTTGLSVLVFNNDLEGKIQSTRQHILSYFLLSSDLKGRIEAPGFYFDKNIYRQDDLDVLMLTQGWRKYNYSRPAGIIRYQPEKSLSVSGTISGIISKKSKKKFHLTLITLDTLHRFYFQTIDSLGRFNFNIPDQFGKDLKVVIKSTNKFGKNRNTTIKLDKPVSPVISFYYLSTVEKADSTVYSLVEKNSERKRVEDSFRMTEGNTLLKEVEINGYNMTPLREYMMKKYGKPVVVISGKALREKEEKWSFGLYSVLMFHYSDIIKIVHRGNDMYARVIGAPSYKPGDGVTLIVIDGIPVREYDYPLVAYIPPGEIKSFEIIRSAKNFSKLYLEADPGTPIRDVPTIGSVIAIYTRAGKGLYGVQKPEGLLYATVPVFSQPKEFYAPKYTNVSATDRAKPDLRTLVHWQPGIVTDSTGNVAISFYNADYTGEMKVIVEAISGNGKIGYKELIFNVEKNNQLNQDK